MSDIESVLAELRARLRPQTADSSVCRAQNKIAIADLKKKLARKVAKLRAQLARNLKKAGEA